MLRSRALLACFLLALAVSGCMRTSGPIAVTQDASLDAMAYGQYHPIRSAAVPATSVTPAAYAYAAHDEPYRLDAGDRLRVVVYGQEGLTNTYSVDAGGSITMPLIGAVRARGLTPAQLAAAITVRLKKGYLREPYVAAEVEAYRPFFILGEVAAPGQYPFVPNMTVESAVAIAGGFTPRAQRSGIRLTRTSETGTVQATVPPGTLLKPGDTVVIQERWF
ncbi:MAG: polysaccharide biosynthesis/export family protein [Pseudomonadota bacterium]|jgi:polysaccharide export outer membrane protein